MQMNEENLRVNSALADQIRSELHAERFDLEEFRLGLQTEMEHVPTLYKYAPDADILEFAGAITLDHLNEDPKYYSHKRSI